MSNPESTLKLALNLRRSCNAHELTPDGDHYVEACSDCRKATREAKIALLKPRKLPAPKFPFWYERTSHSYPDTHYAYGSEGGWGGSPRHRTDRGSKLADCGGCWAARLENWTANVAQWKHPKACDCLECVTNRLTADLKARRAS